MNLDTRHKIVTLDQARVLAEESRRSGSPLAAFVTHLEVLLPGHVRSLEELAAAHAGKLFVILTDPESPLAPLEARAQIAAGLRVVDYVVPSADGAGPALAAIHADLTVHGFTVNNEEEDRGLTRQLIEHVRSRSRI